ncbi:hypothetical protein DRE_04721 [Drechslerella stenobrocha 248]|uniref:NTF2 domain-containing protein n=1 Tax=Drechslerella stenobrocha 248 TaxID=1043628 RepID=W7I120_9PEZI|nr:hypothetical protein DRE_04721 [Drechslerella stenobrocha 248]
MAPHQGPLTLLYSDFLADPKKEVLHTQAGLHYIGSTGASFQSASTIVAHLAREAILYKKTEQKVLSAVEARDAVVVEVDTTIEFVNGGGALLPGLDDNFVTDHTVQLPMVHIVHFEDGLIKQIRLYWEQGCLLKQLGVIGKTGKNWPIRTGEDQVKLIKASVHAVADGAIDGSESAASTRPSSKGSNQSGRENLQLFAPREIDEDVIRPAVLPPRAGMKPPTRQLHDLVGQEGNTAPLPAVQTPKAGSGKAPRRTFFVGQEIDEVHSTPDRKVAVNGKKFNHFEFDDEPPKDSEIPRPTPPKRTSVYSKPGSSWDFADFTTPDKRSGKPSTRNARTYTWSDDEENPSPVKAQPKKLGGTRKDAETHFTFSDNSPAPAPGAEAAAVPAARQTLVKDMDANWSNTSPLGQAKPVPNFSGINIGGDGMGGKKGSSRLWEFEDATPKKPANGSNGAGIKTAGNGMGGRKGTESNWVFQDESPAHAPTQVKGIRTAGNGMGGRKGTDLHWGFGDGAEEESEVPTKKENAPIGKMQSFRKQSQATGDFWEF